jgi:hypothetical protein
MAKPRIVLDTNPIIDLLNGRITEEKLREAVSGCTLLSLNASLLTNDKDLLRLSWPGFQAQGIS